MFAFPVLYLHVGNLAVFIRELDALLSHGFAIWCAVVLGLGAFAIFDASATLGELGFTVHLYAVLFLQFDNGLRVDHGQQYVAQVVASELSAHQSQPAVDAVHGHFTDALQDVVGAFGHASFAHEWLVYHHGTESPLVLLLKDEHHLCHVEVVGVGEVERLRPRSVGFHHGHHLADARVELMLRCCCPSHRIGKHLEHLVAVHTDGLADLVEHRCLVRADLHRIYHVLVIFLLCAHCRFVYD